MKFVHPYIVISVHSYDSIYTLRNAVRCSSLVAFLYYLNNTNVRRARHVPEQTYRRISLRRNMSCSSLYPIQLKRHRLHNVTRDDLVGFHSSNGTKVNDIAYGATTAKVMDWFCQTLDDWSNSSSASKALY